LKFTLKTTAVNPTDFNIDPWDRLLKQYVDRQGRVNYRAWKAEAMGDLTAWLAAMATVNLARISADTRLAFWLNLYNALTIAQILHRYPIASIQPKRLGIPNWFAFLWFFLQPVYRMGDRRYSLNNIEHGILRQQFQEPRIHFALVCASVGCPLLRAAAYYPDQVRQQLDDDARRLINNPDKVRYDAATDTLYCSKIFQWYGKDFLTVAASVPDYIRQYSESTVNPKAAIAFLPYSWALNDQVE